MVPIAQLVRALVCGSRGCGFKSHWAPYRFNDIYVMTKAISLSSLQVREIALFFAQFSQEILICGLLINFGLDFW